MCPVSLAGIISINRRVSLDERKFYLVITVWPQRNKEVEKWEHLRGIVVYTYIYVITLISHYEEW